MKAIEGLQDHLLFAEQGIKLNLNSSHYVRQLHIEMPCWNSILKVLVGGLLLLTGLDMAWSSEFRVDG